MVWEAVRGWCAFGSSPLASKFIKVCSIWRQWAGGTYAENCVLLFKLKQRDLPQSSSVKRWACFQHKLKFCLSQEEGEGRVGNQRLSHGILGFIESLQQGFLLKCKRCFCPKSWCVKSEQGQIKVLRYNVSESWGAEGPQLHDILEQLERPHDVVILLTGFEKFI